MVKWIDLSEAMYGGLSSSPDKLKLTANVAVVSFILAQFMHFQGEADAEWGDSVCVCVGGLRAE